MRFDERFLDELKGRLRLSDVIGRSVKLKRQGREYVGLSPFAKEKSPSFFVNDDKGFFHDFSSGKHGDLIGFLQETERLSFREAVERLAAEAGLALPAEDPRAAEVESRRAGLAEWMEEAAKWFEAQLRRPPGEAARAYLDRRALPAAEWPRFRLGFAPGGRIGLKDHLIAKGARPAELVEAGLLIAPEDGSAPYDRFRDRIIFPITDGRGRVVSFGGRALDPQARAKYLNGPETSLFHKGGLLYGLFEARRLLHAAQARRPEGENAADAPLAALVVVEGYMDVIACQRAGVAAVAPMGTALTEEQMEALWRLDPEPILCFDGDGAGQRAAHRVLDRALPLLKPGRSFRFTAPEGAKDPDDVLREQGAAALRAQLSRTRPFVEVLFARELSEAGDLSTPERLAGLKARLRKFAASIENKDLSSQYRDALMEFFYTNTRKKRYNSKFSQAEEFSDIKSYLSKTPDKIIKERIRTFNAAIAVGAVENPPWIMAYFEELVKIGLGDERLDPIVQPIIDSLQHKECDSLMIETLIDREGAGKVLSSAYHFAREVPAYPFIKDTKKDEERSQLQWSLAFQGMIELRSIENELREREKKEKGEDIKYPDAYIDRGRVLRSKEMLLRHKISDHSIWMGL